MLPEVSSGYKVLCAEQWEVTPSLICPKAKRGSEGNVLRPHGELFPVQVTAAAVTQSRTLLITLSG